MSFVKNRTTLAIIGLLLVIIIGSYVYIASRPNAAQQQLDQKQAIFQQTFTWIQTQNPYCLGAPVRDSNNRIILKDTYEPLLRYELGGTTLRPDLATSWQISPDGLVYTLTLRQGVKFYPSGDTFNAQTLKWSLDTTLTSPTSSMSGAYLFGYPKALQYNHTEIVDDYTVRVFLNKPLAWFLNSLAYVSVGGQMNPKFINAHGGWPKSSTSCDPYLISHQDVTGPYVLEEYHASDRFILRKNPTWWGWNSTNTNRPDHIVVRLVPDDATRILLIGRGDADIAEVNVQYLTELKNRIQSDHLPLLIDEAPSLGIRYIILDQKHAPTNDVHIRKALAWSFNYDAYIKNILFGFGDRLYSLTPIGMWGYDPSTSHYDFNLDKAKAELALADPQNVQMLKDGIKVNFGTGYNSVGKEGLLMWKSDLAKIGVNLILNELPVSAYIDSYKTGGVPAVDRSWLPDFADPGTYYMLMSQSHAQSPAFGTTPDSIDNLIAQATLLTNPDQRLSIYKQIDEWAYENVPHIKVVSMRGGSNYNVRGSWVKGYTSNALAPYKPLFYELWKELPQPGTIPSSSQLLNVIPETHQRLSSPRNP